VVWPSLAEIEPSVAAPGEEIRVEGLGGLTRLTTADGRVTGHLESARSFDLYFDGEPTGSFVCQIGACRGSLTVPEGASPGSHQVSVEGGSSRYLTVTGSSGATPGPAPASTAWPTPTPTPGPLPGTPDSTPVVVWPTIAELEPSVAAPGEEVRVDGRGGHTEFKTADGRVTGYLESAKSFDLYFDGEPIALYGCYLGTCHGALMVPDGASPGIHEISVEGGASRSLTVAGASAATPERAPSTVAPATFSLLTTAFPDAGPIPIRYSCDGEDISPALSWTSAPSGSATFAIVMDDPDAPGGTWDHWTVFNIPSGIFELPEGRPKTPQLPSGARQGSNSWGETGYGGPCPPAGPAHHYRFFLYALDRSLDLPAGASKGEVLEAMAGHILAESLLTGTYGR
jgi:Raf kinase inhibitor-like YbhB/YbcL family protein